MSFGVIHKVRTLRFRNSRPPLPPVRAHTLLAYTPYPPSTSVRLVFFKEDITEINFANYYQSKNHKHRYKIKKLLDKLSKNVESKHHKEPCDRVCAFALYRRDENG